MNEFERESATMDMKEEMMSDAVDDVMDDEAEDEEEEGDKILKEVLDEIGVSLSQQLADAPSALGTLSAPVTNSRQAIALGGDVPPPVMSNPTGNASAPAVGPSGGGGAPGGGDFDDLQARLDALRKP